MNEGREKPHPRRLLAYVGVREGDKGKLLHGYLDVTEDWKEHVFPTDPPTEFSKDLHLYGKRFGFVRPGTVISIEYDAEKEGTIFTDSAHVEGHLEDGVAMAWQATSRAIQTEWDVRRKAKKDAARDLQVEALKPLREAYGSLKNKNQRAALLARVITYITR